MEQNTYITQILLDCLQSCVKTVEESYCTELVDLLNRVAEDMSQPMQLAIIGKISSSKSTLVNAILGEEELVATGKLELTYNVSWLKYGDSEADIKVFLCDGSILSIPREEWKLWANQNVDNLKSGVKYIEVTCHHELLRNINIIDTPGLFSTHGFDSANTIKFLKDVKPDAVLLLSPDPAFAQAAIDVLNEFQGHCISGNYHLSPLNAIGIFAKIDSQWKYQEDKDRTAIEVVDNEIQKCRKNAALKDSLHTVLPISSKLALAATTITDNDVTLIKKLLTSTDYCKMMKSAMAFCHTSMNTPVSTNDRLYLLNKFDIYGIHEIGKVISNGTEDLTSLKHLLNKISGFGDFMYMLNSHFGARSILIKAQNAVRNVVSTCDELRKDLKCDSQKIKCCNAVEDSIQSTVLRLHEYKEIDFLSHIYSDKECSLDSKALEEFKHVSGEYGGSLMDRLDLSINIPIENMLAYAEERAVQWRKLYVVNKVRKPKDAELYNILSGSYRNLSQRVKGMIEEQRAAEKKLQLIKQYIYGNRYE